MKPKFQHIAIITGSANVELAEFYKNIYGFEEVHRAFNLSPENGGPDRPSSIMVSDGVINLALNHGHGKMPVGTFHYGVKIDSRDDIDFDEVARLGGKITGDRVKGRGVFAEMSVIDPLGYSMDLSVSGWRTVPGGPPNDTW